MAQLSPGSRAGSLDAYHAQAENSRCRFLGLLHLSEATIISASHLNAPGTVMPVHDLIGMDASRMSGTCALGTPHWSILTVQN